MPGNQLLHFLVLLGFLLVLLLPLLLLLLRDQLVQHLMSIIIGCRSVAAPATGIVTAAASAQLDHGPGRSLD